MDDHKLLPYLESGDRLPRPKLCPQGIFSMMTKCFNEYPESRPVGQCVHSVVDLVMTCCMQTFAQVVDMCSKIVPDSSIYETIGLRRVVFALLLSSFVALHVVRCDFISLGTSRACSRNQVSWI